MNLYSYVYSNPLSGTDPHGLFVFVSLFSGIRESVDLDAHYSAVAIQSGFALQRQVMYLLMAGVLLDAALEITLGPEVTFFPDGGRKKKCHCMCIKENPLRPGTNILDGPISGITDEDDCKRYPYTTEGEREGYKYCYCR